MIRTNNQNRKKQTSREREREREHKQTSEQTNKQTNKQTRTSKWNERQERAIPGQALKTASSQTKNIQTMKTVKQSKQEADKE